MVKSVEGVFRNGKGELLEAPPQAEDARVLVTFLPSRKEIDLSDRGIDEAGAGKLRGRLRSFVTDWDRPEMDVYDEL